MKYRVYVEQVNQIESISDLVRAIMEANFLPRWPVIESFIDEPGRWTRKRSKLLNLIIKELENER